MQETCHTLFKTYLMKQLLTLVALFMVVIGAHSQSIRTNDVNMMIDQFRRERSSGSVIDQSKYTGISGSPYMVDEFAEGEVFINDSIRFEKVSLRYNIFTDKMEFLDAQKRVLEIDYSAGKFSFLINNNKFDVLSYTENGNSKQGHLELLVDGDIRLYRKYNVQFEEATKPMGFQDPLPKRFVRENDTFLVAISNEIPEAIYKRRDLLTKLNQDSPEIEQYLKNNRLRMSEQSLIDLITYYNNNISGVENK
jgi:hypothetical protein